MKNQFPTRTLSICLVVLFSFTQCRQKSEAAYQSADEVTEAPAVDFAMSKDATDAGDSGENRNPTPVPSSSTADTAVQRMLTKEGTLKWETNAMDKTHSAVIALSKKYDAYISSDNQYRNEYEITTDVEMRIPSDKFDAFISSVEKEVNRFDEKRIEVVDVTEEFIDVSARLKTKKELEQHYYALLKQTKNVSEVLQVEEQLNVVRGDIESAEGRIKYLKDRVSMSTLHLRFYETTSAPVGFFGQIGKSFVEGWKGMLYFILGIISAWPLVLLISFVLFWIIRRRRTKK